MRTLINYTMFNRIIAKQCPTTTPIHKENEQYVILRRIQIIELLLSLLRKEPGNQARQRCVTILKELRSLQHGKTYQEIPPKEVPIDRRAEFWDW